VEGGGWRVEGGGWREEGRGRRVEGWRVEGGGWRGRREEGGERLWKVRHRQDCWIPYLISGENIPN
jgi:hypothetical protein